MKLNTQSLRNIIKNLPPPEFRGEIRRAPLKSRVDEINDEHFPMWGIPSVDATMQLLSFEAVEYATGKHNRWLEWELILPNK